GGPGAAAVHRRDLSAAVRVAQFMDDYDHLDLDEIDFAPVAHDTERLRLLTLDEAHDLLRVLHTVAQEGGAAALEADRLAREIGARVPSVD
ncbi:DUF6417 family protein, partial [Streptomyces sp. NPDC021608]|uniref:DUF6417 family protein n=1 Tax=Streptomyces sp. NPDC021608 TaxID=3154903 RepID=UPI0034050086